MMCHDVQGWDLAGWYYERIREQVGMCGRKMEDMRDYTRSWGDVEIIRRMNEVRFQLSEQ